MHAIKIRRHLDSTTLELPEVAALVGKTVEILVTEPAANRDAVRPLGAFRGQIVIADDFDVTPDAVLGSFEQ